EVPDDLLTSRGVRPVRLIPVAVPDNIYNRRPHHRAVVVKDRRRGGRTARRQRTPALWVGFAETSVEAVWIVCGRILVVITIFVQAMLANFSVARSVRLSLSFI